MPRQFPYVAALAATSLVGTVTTLVWAAQVPVPVHVVVERPVVPVVVTPVARVMTPTPAPSPAALPGNAANTPTSTSPTFPTGNVALQVGAAGAPALTRAAAFGQADLNQPGQPPFSEFFVSQQTAMNQPGQPDIFEGTTNPNILDANEGRVPAQAYPNPVSPQTGVSPAAVRAAGFAQTQGQNVVGFFNGFGPGQADFGFYKGFTSPPAQ